MEKVKLLNIKGEKLKDIKLSDTIFGITPNDKVVYDAVILTRASLRQGTHKTKTRAEVSGGGRKPSIPREVLTPYQQNLIDQYLESAKPVYVDENSTNSTSLFGIAEGPGVVLIKNLKSGTKKKSTVS